VVSAANDYGFVTAAHAHGAEGMKRAVLGGIHSIEHGTMMTPEIMDLMKEKGTYLVATISAGKYTYEMALSDENYFPAIIRPKVLEMGPKIQETFGKAYKAGVKIAFGTDSGIENLRKLWYIRTWKDGRYYSSKRRPFRRYYDLTKNELCNERWKNL